MAAFEGDISGQRVTIELANMTSKQCDAYIVPQISHMASAGGVGGAILRSGAKRGMNAYQTHIESTGALNFGDAYLTTSGGGNSRYLLHVASVDSKKDEQFSTVQKAVYNALLQAEKRGIKTIAAPALGTGALGTLTPAQSAKAMMSAINKFAENGGKFDEISFIIHDSEADQKAFITTLKSKSFENATPEEGQKKFDLDKWAAKFGKDRIANATHRTRK